MRCCVRKTTLGIIGGFVLIFAGVAVMVGMKLVLPVILRSKLQIQPGTIMYNMWKDMPVPIRFEVWVFDVQNPEEVLQGKKPVLVQKGPYTYWTQQKKEDVTFFPNMSVSYNDVHHYYFDRSLSVGDDSDTFTNFNVPLLAAASVTQYEYEFIKAGLAMTHDIVPSPLLTTLTVRDILWGYPDPLLTVVVDILNKIGVYIIDKHFGFFYNKNGTVYGTFNAYTGVDDLTKTGHITSYDYQRILPFWSSRYANTLNGSDGTAFGPFVDKTKRQYVFSQDACRSVYVDYEGETEVKGIHGYHYRMPLDIFSPPDVVPENADFCTPDVTHCLPAGLLNVSNCRYGGPFVLSLPHILGGDPSLFMAVSGLNPTPDLQPVLDIEPIAGIPLNVQMKFQIVQHVTRYPVIKESKNISPAYVPLLWFNESTTITDSLAREIRDSMMLPLAIVNVLQYLFFAFGGCLLLVCITLKVVRRAKESKRQKKLALENENTPILKGQTSSYTDNPTIQSGCENDTDHVNGSIVTQDEP